MPALTGPGWARPRGDGATGPAGLPGARRQAPGWPSATGVGNDVLSVIAQASALVVALSVLLRAGLPLAAVRLGGATLPGIGDDTLPWWPMALMLGAATLLFGALLWLARRAGRGMTVIALLTVGWLTGGHDLPFAILSTW